MRRIVIFVIAILTAAVGSGFAIAGAPTADASRPQVTVTRTITQTVTATVTPSPATVTVTKTVTATPASSTSATSPAPVPTPGPGLQPAVTRSGAQLLRGGVAWRAVGFNLPNIFGCNTADTAAATDARLDQYFAGLPAHSLTRIWPYAGSQWQSMMPRVVKAAEAHGQYLMPVLADANRGGTQCGSNLGATYPADGGAVKAHATAVVSAFKGSPAIAIWEILNEGSRSASAKPFYASVSAEIKRIDPASVVAYGVGTCYQSIGTAAWNECKDTLNQPGNDLVDFHEYDPGPGVSWWTDENKRIATDTGRPWVVGEFGFCCGGAASGFTSFDSAAAAGLVRAEWAAYLNSGASGVLYWSAVTAYGNTFYDQLSPSKAAWAGIGSFTDQWQGT